MDKYHQLIAAYVDRDACDIFMANHQFVNGIKEAEIKPLYNMTVVCPSFTSRSRQKGTSCGYQGSVSDSAFKTQALSSVTLALVVMSLINV